MKVILINGSPNEHGCTDRALQECKAQLEKNGIEAEILWITKAAMPGCMACGACRSGKGCIQGGVMNEIAEKLRAADGMIVGSPVYYASVNGSLLSLMDRVYYTSAPALRGKPFGAVVSARRAGTTASLDILNKYALINDQPVVGSSYWTMVHGALNTPSDVEKDEEGLQTMRRLADNMAYLLRCMEAGKAAGIEMKPRDNSARTNFIR